VWRGNFEANMSLDERRRGTRLAARLTAPGAPGLWHQAPGFPLQEGHPSARARITPAQCMLIAPAGNTRENLARGAHFSVVGGAYLDGVDAPPRHPTSHGFGTVLAAGFP
jgi:hypothetical protein